MHCVCFHCSTKFFFTHLQSSWANKDHADSFVCVRAFLYMGWVGGRGEVGIMWMVWFHCHNDMIINLHNTRTEDYISCIHLPPASLQQGLRKGLLLKMQWLELIAMP